MGLGDVKMMFMVGALSRLAAFSQSRGLTGSIFVGVLLPFGILLGIALLRDDFENIQCFDLWQIASNPVDDSNLP